MSKDYRDKNDIELEAITSPEMREHCKRPGRFDEEGNIIYFTEQAHKEQCDVNEIIRRYDKTGLITHVSKFEAQFGDLDGTDFKQAQDLVINAKRQFDELPSKIRNRFENDPGQLLAFMADPENRNEAIELGLINSNWTEATDGIGEHVPLGGNIDKPTEGPRGTP